MNCGDRAVSLSRATFTPTYVYHYYLICIFIVYRTLQHALSRTTTRLKELAGVGRDVVVLHKIASGTKSVDDGQRKNLGGIQM